MAIADLAALTAPVSDADPCGPDLDLKGDLEFMNFMARVEGLLPATFFSGPEGQPFDRGTIDFAAEFEGARPFLAQTRDLRLLALLAKLHALNRDLDGFVTCVKAVAALLEERWDDVHPRGEGGDFGVRMAVIETLDDSAPVVMPLQHMPLIQSRRSGPVSYRHFMMAAGEVAPREGEDTLAPAVLDRALAETELETLIAQRGRFEALQAALDAIRRRCGEGGDRSVSLEKVAALSAKIFDLLNGAIAKRDPSAAVATPAVAAAAQDGADGAAPDAAPATASAIRSNADVLVALDALNRYFCRFEPSNPALLLVRQAQQLMGKSFLEVMQILVPDQIGQARFQIGKDRPFEIPIERLSSFATVEPVEEPAEGEMNGAPVALDAPAPERAIIVESRRAAFILLEQIGAYYRSAEPSSPIAFITDRARSFADRDFATLLKDVLPSATE